MNATGDEVDPARVGETLDHLAAIETHPDVIDTSAAAAAFTVLDSFLQDRPFTAAVADLEGRLDGATAETAARIAAETPFSQTLIDAALIVRQRVGVIDSVIHAAVITQIIPLILEPGERLAKRPSLGAGNDETRPFDLETDRRIAEVKLASWNGGDGGRERSLFADLVGLTLDQTGRRRQLFVVGTRPVKYLTTSRANAAKRLSKAALKVRDVDSLSQAPTIAEFTAASGVEVIDLLDLLPSLLR